MVRKTRQRPRPRPRPRPRQRPQQNTKKVESHRYLSTMTFDGNTVVMKSQKDEEPIKQTVYTKKQLEREIPIGKELIDEYLDGEIPPGIQRPIPKEIVFRSVLPNPADLGLLPPNASSMKKYKLKQQMQTKRRRESQSQDRYNKQGENMRLIVQDTDDDAALDADYTAGATNRKHAHNLFDLP